MTDACNDMKKRVKALRERTGKSQSKFAQYFDIPVKTLQTWEAGGACPPAYVIGMMERILELENKILEGRRDAEGSRFFGSPHKV